MLPWYPVFEQDRNRFITAFQSRNGYRPPGGVLLDGMIWCIDQTLLLLFEHRLRIPDLRCIFTYRAVTGEFPHAGYVKNRAARPSGARP